MARSVWKGHLRLSLVTCPVALYKATDTRGDISFNLINPKTKSRIVQVVKDPTTGQELDRKKRGQKVTTAPPVEKDAGKVIDLMDALRRSLVGKGGGSKERAVERKNGKAAAKATPKKKKRAV